MSYTPVAASPQTEQDREVDNLASHASRLVRPHISETQRSILLENLASRPRPSRRGSAASLLKHDADSKSSSNSLPIEHRKPHFLSPSTWLWEILSLSLAIVILVSLVAVLALYDRKPSPVAGGITLNTVVAFAATLFRICLMVPVTTCLCQLTWVWVEKGYRPLGDVVNIDMASRGPLGSLLLLYKLSYSPLLSIAAVIMVIGIAIGPFLQQSVVFYSDSVPFNTDEVAFASTAFTYDGSHGSLSDLDLPFNMKSAIQSGLFSSGMVSLPTPPYSCPTGNCTWTPFPTLGVSVKCFDESSQYPLNCTYPFSAPIEQFTFTPCVLTQAKGNGSSPTQIQWLISTSKIFNGSSYWGHSFQDLLSDHSKFNDVQRVSAGISDQELSLYRGAFTGFAWQLARNLSRRPREASQPQISSSSTAEAGKCLFYMSVQEIRAQVVDGSYSERITRVTTKIKPGANITQADLPDIIHVYKPECNTTGESSKCSAQESSEVEFRITREASNSLFTVLSKVLPSSNVTTGIFGGVEGSAEAESLYQSPNITRTMHTIAHYMTVAMRANDTILALQRDPGNTTHIPANFIAPSHRVNGTVYVQVVHLRVRWGWLALPAGLALVVAGLLFETIRSSQRETIGVWKNNPLAVLLNTDWRPEHDLVGAATSEQMELLADGLEARAVHREGATGVSRRMVDIRQRIRPERT